MPRSSFDFTALREQYSNLLLEDIIPWWLRHGVAPSGAIQTCIGDDRTVYSSDLWGWSQWRAVWVFSKLYNTLEPNAEWLNVAKGVYRFLSSHGPVEGHHWPLLHGGDGSIKRGFESLGVDGFAIYGLAEFYRATGDPEVRDLALGTYEAVERELANPTPGRPEFPYPLLEGWMDHSLSMMLSLFYWELGNALDRDDIREKSLLHHRQVMDVFLQPDGLLLERLQMDGTPGPSPLGTTVVPGHAIESMWFQIHIARDRNDLPTLGTAVESIRKHIEFGWDQEFGGITLALDKNGRQDVAWKWHDTKLWWPQVEALYATMLAWELTQEPWCLEWHDRIRNYCFAHYPVKEHGEWTQKLDRQGRVLDVVIALPVKDPFHLPRVLIYLTQALDRIAAAKL